MRNRFSTSLTALLLAALMLGGVLFMPATALAARSKAKSAAKFLDELSSAQLVIGRDTNSFEHSKKDFPYTYELDAKYQQVLFDMATRKETVKLVEKMDVGTISTGSCYGVSGTIVLNYLAQYKGRKVLSAAQMQKGAKKYFDIRSPKRNRLALNYINFLMLSQFVKASQEGAVERTRLVPGMDGARRYINLNGTILTAIRYIDSGLPFQLGYSYPKKDKKGKIKTKGHALVGYDYYIRRDKQNGDLLYLKCYDENDRGHGTPHSCYLKFKVTLTADGKRVKSVRAPSMDANGNERMYIYYYNYAKNNGSYTPKFITGLRVRNMETIYNNLKKGGAGRAGIFNAASSASSSPVLTLYDVSAYYDNYRIRPFVYKDMPNNTVDYADSCGRLYKFTMPDVPGSDYYDDEIPVEPPELIDFPPIPVDEGNENLPFGNMVGFDTDEPGYRYETYEEGEEDEEDEEDEEEDSLDIEIDLLKEGNVDKNKRRYDGYDIALEGDTTLPGVSLEYGSSFAFVSGEDIELVRFSSDGRLRDVKAEENGNGSMELYFGTEDELKGLDMFRMELKKFSFLQVYDKQDSGDFEDCVVLRTDGLANGFDFTFYKDALLSDDYEGRSEGGGAEDTWIKIKAFENAQSGELGVTVWMEEDGGNDMIPDFDAEPVFTEELHERPSMPDYPSSDSSSDNSSDSSSEYIPAARQTVHNNDAAVSLSSVAISAGDALIAQPLTSGADYNFMLGLAGNNEVVKLYDIHLASGQSALGGGAELCFALGARYANEEFTLAHKKADGSVEYFYARADASGNLCFTGIYSLSPFMLVKGRLSATAVTMPITEVPATGGSAIGAYGALLLLAAFTLLRSRRKYTEK